MKRFPPERNIRQSAWYRARYVESEHPRDPGGEGGGQWIKKGTRGEGGTKPKAKKPKSGGEWATKIKTAVHVTSEEAAQSIEREGFRKSGMGFGNVFGEGVYLSLDKETAEYWRNFPTVTGEAPVVLEVDVDVDNPFVVTAKQLGEGASDEWRRRIVELAGGDSRNLSPTRGVSGALEKLGYDSLVILDKGFTKRGYTDVGGSQILVFDPNKVRVKGRSKVAADGR